MTPDELEQLRKEIGGHLEELVDAAEKAEGLREVAEGLREGILDFGRGVITLPELLNLAEQH